MPENPLSLRGGSIQGSKHIQWGINNQDDFLVQTFAVPALGKIFTVGLVSDGSTNLPALSRTEVGSRLLILFAFTRIQELLCSGAELEDIPLPLYRATAEFIRDLANKIMPPDVVWNYPFPNDMMPARHRNRLTWTAAKRFRIDYLSATLLGFISDGERAITFTAGDGIVIVDNQIHVIDQNDMPEYPAASINAPGKGFVVQVYSMADVQRLAVCTDGPKRLLENKMFLDAIFTHQPESFMGLQTLLRLKYMEAPELMEDDCTIVALTKRATD